MGDACEVLLRVARLAAAVSLSECRGALFVFSFMSGAIRGSTNCPTHISVPGYEMGPIDKVMRAIHSVWCAGGSSLSPEIDLEVFFGSSVGVDEVADFGASWYSLLGRGCVGGGGVGKRKADFGGPRIRGLLCTGTIGWEKMCGSR